MSARTLLTAIVTLAVVTSMFVGGIALPTQAGHSESVQTGDTVRITDINRAQSTVNTGDNTSLRFRIENTGKDDVTVQPDINVNGGRVVDYHKSPNPTNAPSFQIEGESSIVIRADVVFNQESDSGTTSVEVGLDGSSESQEYIYTVDDSATTYNSSLETTGKRQDISKFITSYKDERGESANQNYDDSIPPLKQTSSGFESDASGEVRQFTNAREENGEPMTIDSVNDRLKVGFHVDNVPTESHYSMKFNYRVTQGSGVLVNVVKSDGTPVDNNTTYELGSTDRKTTYFRLSKQEQDYISSQNQIYLVFENINQEETTIDIFSSTAESADRPVTTEVPQYTNLNVSSSKDQYASEEIVQINGEYENTGSHYKTQTVDLLRNGNLVNRKQVTVAPGKTNTFSFKDSVEQDGIYEYRIDNTSTYVQVGSGSGTSGNATSVISLDESEETNRSEMEVPYTEDSVFIDTAGVYHIDTNQKVILNGSESYHTHPDENINSYSWSQTGGGFNGDPLTGDADRYEVSWARNGTKQVELTTEGSDGSTSTTQLTVRVGSTSPNARYTYQPQSPTVGQSIDFNALESSHPTQNDSSLTYEWDFDDGTTTTTQSEIVRHEYDSSGKYTVTLTVRDQYGNTNTRTKTVTVESSEIVPDFVYNPLEPTVGETVTFDGKDSEAKIDGEVIVEHNWDVNGTMYNDAQITHEFESQGQHPVTLTVVTNNDNTETLTKNVSVIGKEFTVITEDEFKEKGPGQTVEFNATPTQDPDNQIEEWKWEFGDGTVIPYGEAKPRETHTYNIQDDYEATVYARGKGFEGFDTVNVTISNEPVANAGDDKTREWIDTFTVDGSDSYAVGDNNTIEQYKWEMGDGTTYNNTNPAQDHQYDGPGIYDVTLTVTDSTGKTDSDTVRLTYPKDPPVAMITDFATDDREDNINGTNKDISIGDELELYGDESYEPSETSEPISNYTWEMDDGTTYYTENITHQFEEQGTYNVTLTVGDEYGVTDTTHVNVTVIDGIDVDYEINDTYTHHRTTEQKQRNMTNGRLTTDYEYNFNASKTTTTSSEYEYRWNMDDGTTYTTTNETIKHAYTDSGTYSPRVEVYVNGGYVGEETENVVVESETENEVYYEYGEQRVPWVSSALSNSGTGEKGKWNSRLWLRTNSTENSATRQHRTGQKVNLTDIDYVEVEYEIEQGREVNQTVVGNGDTVRTFDVSNSYSAYAELSGADGARVENEQDGRADSVGGEGGYVNGAMRTASYDSIEVHVGEKGKKGAFYGNGGNGRHDGGDGGLRVTNTQFMGAGGGGASTELYLPNNMSESNFVLVADGGGGGGNSEYDSAEGTRYCAGGGGGARGGSGANVSGNLGDGEDGDGEGYGGDGGQGYGCGEPRGGQGGGYEINYNYIPSTPATITSGDVGTYAEESQSGKAFVQLYNRYEQKSGNQGNLVVDINGTKKNVSISGTENYRTGRIRVDTSDIEGKERITLQTNANEGADGTVETKVTKVQGHYNTSAYAYITNSSAASSKDDNINGSTKSVGVGDEVELFGEYSYSPVGNITLYEWRMGYGTTYYGENVSHTFDEEGTYDVRLKVRNEFFVSDTANVTVNVGNPNSLEEDESGWSAGGDNEESNWNHTDDGTLRYEGSFNGQNYSYNADSDTNNGHKLSFEIKFADSFSESGVVGLRNDSTGDIASGEVESDLYSGESGDGVLEFAGNEYRDSVNGDWDEDEWINATVYYDPKNGECRMYIEQDSSGKTLTIDESSNAACQTGNAADDVDEIKISGWTNDGGVEYRNISVQSYDSSS